MRKCITTQGDALLHLVHHYIPILMATSKPRITVTLDPRVYEVVSRLAAVNGRSMSSVITDFLDLVQPQMTRMVSVLEAAQKASGETAEGIRASLAKAEQAIRPALLESLKQTQLELDQHGLDWGDVGPEHPERARGGRGQRRPSPPVPVTRGVGTPKQKKTASKKAR